jgi:hypothetical protein
MQKRGAWQFHLLLFISRSAYNCPEELRHFVAFA